MKDDLLEVFIRTGRDRRMGTNRNINCRKGSGKIIIRIGKTNDRGMGKSSGMRGERPSWRRSRRGRKIRDNRFSRGVGSTVRAVQGVECTGGFSAVVEEGEVSFLRL